MNITTFAGRTAYPATAFTESLIATSSIDEEENEVDGIAMFVKYT
jgi:hypothetical protein